MIIAVVTDTRSVGAAAAIAIGGVIGLDALFGGPVTGASMNPARSFGPALVSGTDRLLGLRRRPILGPALGAFAYQLVRGTRQPQRPAPELGSQPDGARSVRLPT